MQSSFTSPGGVFPFLSALVLLLAASLCLLIILFWILRKARRAASNKPVAAPGPSGSPVQAKTSGARSEFNRFFHQSIKALQNLTVGRGFRYDIPWVLAIGRPDSGKTTVLEGIGLKRISTPETVTRTAAKLRLGWFLFREGLVVDTPGEVLLGKEELGQDLWWWRRTLWQLRAVRSQRPLDGIVLMIPIEDLRVGGSASYRETLASQATLIRERISEAQKQLEMRLPVYVVLTKCDQLPGFNTFCQELPKDSLRQMAGWSNPHSVDLAYSPAWAYEAVHVITERIDRLCFEIFAAKGSFENGDALFLLSSELAGLRDTLHSYLSQIFSEAAYFHAPSLRGIYLTGDIESDVRHFNAELTTLPSTEVTQQVTDRQAGIRYQYRPAFLDDLFAQKIFAERGLATPFPNAFLSKNRVTLGVQVATVVFLVVCGLGSILAFERLGTVKQEQLIPLLQALKEEATVSSFNTDTAFQVIRAMTDLQAGSFRSIFVPGSWSGHMNDLLESVMIKSFLNVFAGLRSALRSKQTQIVAAAAVMPGQCLNPGSQETHFSQLTQYQKLEDYLSALQQWNLNVEIFNRIVTPGQGNAAYLKKLVLYLRPDLLPQDVDFQHNRLFERALSAARDSTYRDYSMEATTKVAEQLSQCFFNSWFTDNALLNAGSALEKQIENLQNEALGYDDLLQLARSINVLSSLLDGPHFTWASKEHFDASDYPVFQNPVLQSRALDQPALNAYIHAAGEKAFQSFQSKLTAPVSPGIGSLVEPAANGYAVSDQLVTLSAFIGKLQQQPFSSRAPEGRSPTQSFGRWVVWSPESLTAASQLYQSYVNYSFQSSPTIFRAPLQKLAATRAEANMLDLIASAESFQSSPKNGLTGESIDLLAANNLSAVLPALTDLLQTFRHPGFQRARTALGSVLTDQANQLLSSLDARIAASNPYNIRESNFNWWNGQSPVSVSAYQAQTSDEVKAYVAAQTATVRQLAKAAEPALTLLQVIDSLSAMPVRQTGVNWAAVIEDFKSYDAKKPNPINSLETFLTSGMDKVSPETTCEDNAFPGASGQSDLFLRIGYQLRTQLVNRCQQLATGGYVQIANSFNTLLAGKFPFADASGPLSQPEADPADVIKFYKIYDHYQQGARQILQRKAVADPLSGRQLEFLQQLQSVRGVFAGFIAGYEKDPVPTFNLQVQFRTNRSMEISGDQIIDWQLDTGAQSFALYSKTNTGDWRMGEPIRVTLRFAKDSPSRPVSGSNPMEQGVASNRTVSFEYPDNWSLFRLIQRRRIAGSASATAMAFGPTILSFYIPTTPDPSVAPVLGQTIGGQVRVFLQLTVTPPGAKDGLLFPPFPAEAPVLNSDLRTGT